MSPLHDCAEHCCAVFHRATYTFLERVCPRCGCIIPLMLRAISSRRAEICMLVLVPFPSLPSSCSIRYIDEGVNLFFPQLVEGLIDLGLWLTMDLKAGLGWGHLGFSQSPLKTVCSGLSQPMRFRVCPSVVVGNVRAPCLLSPVYSSLALSPRCPGL